MAPPRSQIGVGLAFCLIASTPASAYKIKLHRAQVEPISFAAMPGWQNDDHAAAFDAFQKSCGTILQGTPAMRRMHSLYGALFKVCERAKAVGALDRDKARAFFEANFNPARIAPQGETEGFFTGYYETEVDGSRYPSDEYTVPIYAAPTATMRAHRSKVFANLSRTDIEDGAIAGKGLEICYVKDPVDAFFAQIQGSTRVKLDNGQLLRLNYIASNGAPYTPVGKFLIDERHLHQGRDVDGQDPRVYGGQPDSGKRAAAQEPLLRVFSGDAARTARRMHRRAGHSAHAAALAGGGQEHSHLRHADLDRRAIPDRKREARNDVPPSAFRAGRRLGHCWAGACRYLFRSRRGGQPHRRPHQAARAVRDVGAAGRGCNWHHARTR